MITIRILSNQGEAAFLLSLLQGNGFDAVLLDEGAFQYSAVMQSMRLQVPDDEAPEAITFLQTRLELRPGFTYPETEPEEENRSI